MIQLCSVSVQIRPALLLECRLPDPMQRSSEKRFQTTRVFFRTVLTDKTDVVKTINNC